MRNYIFLLLLLQVSVSIAQTDVLLTDFQNGIPLDYSIVDNDGLMPDVSVSEYTAAWIARVDPDNALDTVASATSFFSPSGTADRWMITPPLSLGNYGNFIEWQTKSQDASYGDDYLVLVSTTDDQLASFNDTIGYVIQENPDWTSRTVDLSAEGYNSQTIYVAFRLITTDGFKLYLDDIHVWKEDPVGIDEVKSSAQISCFPNPGSDLVTIESSQPIQECQIYSMNGKRVKAFNSNSFSVREFDNGVYFIRVLTTAGEKTLKFVKN
jgi:hypothetical protein